MRFNVFLFTYSLVHLFSYLLIFLFTYFLIYLFSYLLIHLFTYSLIYLFTYSLLYCYLFFTQLSLCSLWLNFFQTQSSQSLTQSSQWRTPFIFRSASLVVPLFTSNKRKIAILFIFICLLFFYKKNLWQHSTS